jgi:uroporphyrinogen-III synthase
MPAIEVKAALDSEPLREALLGWGGFDWVIFTSVNGVAEVVRLTEGLAIDFSGPRLAAIGPATAQAVEAAFGRLDVVPESFISDAIAPALGDVASKRILLPRADIARKELALELERRGAEVVELAIYGINENIASTIPEVRPDYITVTSSSAVRGVVNQLVSGCRSEWIAEVSWVCIGPITEHTAREFGCNVVAVAAEFTVDGVIRALLALHAGRPLHV